jgi:hypothetical protein
MFLEIVRDDSQKSSPHTEALRNIQKSKVSSTEKNHFVFEAMSLKSKTRSRWVNRCFIDERTRVYDQSVLSKKPEMCCHPS